MSVWVKYEYQVKYLDKYKNGYEEVYNENECTHGSSAHWHMGGLL